MLCVDSAISSIARAWSPVSTRTRRQAAQRGAMQAAIFIRVGVSDGDVSVSLKVEAGMKRHLPYSEEASCALDTPDGRMPLLLACLLPAARSTRAFDLVQKVRSGVVASPAATHTL